MNGVIYQRKNRLLGGIKSLNNAAAWIIQLLRIIIIGDFAFRFSGSDLDPNRLQPARCFLNRLGHSPANYLQIFRIATRSAFAVRKTVSIRGAMRVRSTNENVLGGHLLHRLAYSVAETGRKAQKVRADDGHARIPLS